jgi:hypothetical protein
MISTRLPITLAVTVAALGLSQGVVSAQAAKPKKPSAAKKATTVTACVNKKTGAVKVLLGSKAKKKCPRGSTKVQWSTAGRNGTNGKSGLNGVNGVNGINGIDGVNGPGGSPLNVRDANGKAIGTFIDYGTLGLPIYQVLVDGGLYSYLATGQLMPPFTLTGSSASPAFLDGTCSGTAYQLTFGDPGVAGLSAQLLGGPMRFVFRTTPEGDETSPLPTGFDGLGPASAWKATTTTRSLTDANVWALDSVTGACTKADDTYTGGLVALTPVPAPADAVGPLSIG